jgi:hypothetical protein
MICRWLWRRCFLLDLKLSWLYDELRLKLTEELGKLAFRY